MPTYLMKKVIAFVTPASTIRASYQVYPYLTNQRTYSNISQYFSFTMSKIEADKVIKQFGGK